MLFLLMSFVLLSPQQPAAAPAQAEIDKIKAAMQAACETFAQQARHLNGTLTVYQLDGDKKTMTRKATVKSDKTRYFIFEENGQNMKTFAELYRPAGDTKQALHLVHSNIVKKLFLQTEQYKKIGDPDGMFPIEINRVFAYDAPSTLAFRPIPQERLTFLDLLDYPAVKVTAIENSKKENQSLVKVSFQVDPAINDQQIGDRKVYGIKNGSVTFRPDHLWTVDSSEYTFTVTVRRQPPRDVVWKTQYVYGPPADKFPMLKEVRLESTPAKDAPDQKPTKQLYEMDFKIITTPLPDDAFSLKQIDVAERTVEEWKREEAERLRTEAEESAKISKLPPEKLKPAGSGLNISPWVWLGGGLVLFIAIMVAVFEMTDKKGKKNVPANGPPAANL